MSDVLTIDDVVSQVSAQTRLTAQDVRDFLACSDEQRALLVQTYKDSNQMPTASSWDIFLNILSKCAQVAGMIAPIIGVISSVYGLVKTIAG